MATQSQEGASVTESTRAERLRRWVVVIGVLAIVVNLAIVAYTQWRSYRFAVEDNSRELTNDARILAAQAEGTFKAVDVLLREVVDGHMRGRNATVRDVDALLTARAQGLPQLLSLAIADGQGNEVLHTDLALTAGGLESRITIPERTIVPEPAGFLLLSSGILGLAGRAWCRRKRAVAGSG